MDIVVFIDTNVLNGYPWLGGRVWDELLRTRAGLNVRVILSEIVVLETAGMVNRSAGPALDTLKRGRLLGADFEEHASEQLQTYEERFRQRLQDLGIEILEPDRDQFLGAIKRAAQRTAPALPTSQGKAKSGGTRDAALWLQLFDLARATPRAQVWLITDNSSDFGSSPDREPEELMQRGAPELADTWHPHLASELKKAGLIDRVFQARQLRNFNQHLDALEAAIADPEKYAPPNLSDDLRLQVALSLRTLATGFTLQSDSLLGVDNTADFTVLDVDIDPAGITLSDVTQTPGSATWQANVSVACPATIVVRTVNGDVERRRRVTVRGLVEASAGGAVAIRQVDVGIHQTLREIQEAAGRVLAPHFASLQSTLAGTDWAASLAAQEGESLKRAAEAAQLAVPDLGEFAGLSKLATEIGNSSGLAAQFKRAADSVTFPDFNAGSVGNPAKPGSDSESDDTGFDEEQGDTDE